MSHTTQQHHSYKIRSHTLYLYTCHFAVRYCRRRFIREGSWLRAVTASPREKLVSDGSHDHLTNSLLSSSLHCNVYSVLQASTLRFNRPYRLYRVKIRPRSVAGARIHYKTSMRCRLGWPRGWLREAQVGDERLRSEPKSQRLREHRTEPLGARRSLRSSPVDAYYRTEVDTTLSWLSSR